jgi:hypothetical protein
MSSSDSVLPRTLLIFGLCVPLALMLGYLLATPTDTTSVLFVGTVFLSLLLPFFLLWHHLMVAFCWNASLVVFLLPGQPSLGVAVAAASFFLAFINHIMRRDRRFLSAPSLTRPLLFTAVIVVGTIVFTGGIGGRALGSEAWGAKRYLGLFGAVVGYFALTSQRIPWHQAGLYGAIFFLSGVTAVISDMAFAAGPSFYFLFAIFPSELAYLQAVSQMSLVRITGLAFAANSVMYYLLLRFGLRGVLDFSKVWRLVFFTLLAGASLFGGFRSSVILIFILALVMFFLEGLHRQYHLVLLVGFVVLGGVFLWGFADRLPLAVQRSISFLPFDVNPVAKDDAMGTLEWRVDMWKIAAKDVPKYLLLGKGYSFSGTDYYLTEEAVKRNMFRAYESTLISGNYHNGILTLIIPFGIFGTLGFVWFCWAAIKALLRNYKYGDPELQTTNRFLLGYFITRLIFYLVFYGQFDMDFMIFTGIVGFSVSLNGGICQPAPAPATITYGVRSLPQAQAV